MQTGGVLYEIRRRSVPSNSVVAAIAIMLLLLGLAFGLVAGGSGNQPMGASGMTYQITVVYEDGSQETFNGCSDTTRSGNLLSFTGKLGDATEVTTHEINWDNVRRITKKAVTS